MIYAKPLQQSLGSSGITISFSPAKTGSHFRIGISQSGQIKHFGKEIDETKDGLSFILHDDPEKRSLGQLTLAPLDAEGTLALRRGMKGSLYFKAEPWRNPPPPDKQAAVDLKIRKIDGKKMLVELPPWARPQSAPPKK